MSIKTFLKSHKSLVIMGAFLALSSTPAFCSSADVSAFKGLTNVLAILQGPVGVTLATLAIMGAGAAIAVTKGQGVGTMFWVIVGVGIVFGAGTLVTNIFGTSSGFSVPEVVTLITSQAVV